MSSPLVEVKQLFSLAEEVAHEDPYLANRYVTLAKKVSLKNRVSLQQYNRVHCRKCNTFFTSRTLQVRTLPHYVVYHCLNCEHVTRIQK